MPDGSLLLGRGQGEPAAAVLLNECEAKPPSKHLGLYMCVRLLRLSALVRETSVCCE